MKSNYTDRNITPAQYLAEFICERQAQKQKVSLFNHFWNSEAWKKTFQHQVVIANRLLKSYTLVEIINVLNSYKGKRITSLGNHWQLVPLLKAEAKKRSLKTDTKIEKADGEVPKKIFRKKSILDEL